MSPHDIAGMAKKLADGLQEDIKTCKTREDHIRVTARANEAALLLQGLNQMFDTTELDSQELH
jgi:hypothetical protein